MQVYRTTGQYNELLLPRYGRQFLDVPPLVLPPPAPSHTRQYPPVRAVASSQAGCDACARYDLASPYHPEQLSARQPPPKVGANAAALKQVTGLPLLTSASLWPMPGRACTHMHRRMQGQRT